jgi:hypothetical protein
MRKLLFILFLIQPLYAADFYETNIKGDRITIDTIKDVKGDFEPSVKFDKWNNEEHLKYTFKSDSKFKADEKTSDNKVKVANDDMEISYYTEGDNMKVVLTFNKKPKNNIYSFDIEGWENFDFFYQEPWANYQEIEWQGKTYLEKLDNPMIKSRRLPEGQGSYAVYHKTKRDHIEGQTNYATGKFGHIYRPKAVDNNADYVWADLIIENGVYTVTIPQDFLDKAAYPVIINDTFGTANVGGDAYGQVLTQANITKWALSAAGDATKMTIYCAGDGGTHPQKGIIYDDNATGGEPLTFKGATGATNCTSTPGWVDHTFASALALTIGNWYIGRAPGDATGVYIYYDDDSMVNRDVGGDFNYASPGDWNNAGDDHYTGLHSVYVTYTPSGGAPAAKGIPVIIMCE